MGKTQGTVIIIIIIYRDNKMAQIPTVFQSIILKSAITAIRGTRTPACHTAPSRQPDSISMTVAEAIGVHRNCGGSAPTS